MGCFKMPGWGGLPGSILVQPACHWSSVERKSPVGVFTVTAQYLHHMCTLEMGSEGGYFVGNNSGELGGGISEPPSLWSTEAGKLLSLCM